MSAGERRKTLGAHIRAVASGDQTTVELYHGDPNVAIVPLADIPDNRWEEQQ